MCVELKKIVFQPHSVSFGGTTLTFSINHNSLHLSFENLVNTKWKMSIVHYVSKYISFQFKQFIDHWRIMWHLGNLWAVEKYTEWITLSFCKSILTMKKKERKGSWLFSALIPKSCKNTRQLASTLFKVLAKKSSQLVFSFPTWIAQTKIKWHILSNNQMENHYQPQLEIPQVSLSLLLLLINRQISNYQPLFFILMPTISTFLFFLLSSRRVFQNMAKSFTKFVDPISFHTFNRNRQVFLKH